MSSIWVVEDDPSIGQGLVRALESEHHRVEWATTVSEVWHMSDPPDLVLLDLNLPDGDGVALCRRLLTLYPALRVVMLTARASELDVVSGLDAGAIDYLTKPFRLAELLARVRAQLRATELEPDVNAVQTVGDLTIDRAARRVWVDGREIELRLKEFDVLARLAETPGTVVRRDDLMGDVWDNHWFGSTKTLDVHMATLRRHLGEEAGDRSRIRTIRGVGYRLDP